jgi:ketosteroid isomerase-like protein
MSEENVEIIRAAYEPLSRGDWDAVFRNLHTDFVVTTQRAGGPYRGRNEVQTFVEDQRAPFEDLRMEPEKVFEAGDLVVVYVKMRGQPRGSSAEIESRVGHLWTLRDDRAESLQLFPRREDALEAAGLRE